MEQNKDDGGPAVKLAEPERAALTFPCACGGTFDRTIDSRSVPFYRGLTYRRRRRVCYSCDARMTTAEIRLDELTALMKRVRRVDAVVMQLRSMLTIGGEK